MVDWRRLAYDAGAAGSTPTMRKLVFAWAFDISTKRGLRYFTVVDGVMYTSGSRGACMRSTP
jgi:hypothetical protein